MTLARIAIIATLSLPVATTSLAAQGSVSINAAAWLAGCWSMTRGNTVIEEQWMAPAGSTMMGMGRTVQAGKLLEYELVVLRAQGDKLEYRAHPSGQASAVFTATVVSDTLLQFDNPQHDFPRLVAYRRIGTDSLRAWIAASAAPTAKQVVFPYHRVSCAGVVTP
jgi:hypothetical protein